MALWRQRSDAYHNKKLLTDHSVHALGHDRARPLQVEPMQAVLQGQDMFLNLQTGHGKSLVYQILPICACFISAILDMESAVVPVVLFVSPLVVLTILIQQVGQ